ncbi:MAG: hypothetical protein ACR2JB_06865 [Bryobacteraceae bacterium]
MSERYDLLIRKQHLDLPRMQNLLDALSRSGFRRELERFGGYDARVAGQRVLSFLLKSKQPMQCPFPLPLLAKVCCVECRRWTEFRQCTSILEIYRNKSRHRTYYDAVGFDERIVYSSGFVYSIRRGF